MDKYRFYKEDKRWYVDLPDWTGPKSALEMVCGADTMLDHMSDNGLQVLTLISKTEFEGANELKLKALAEDIGEGAYYTLESYEGEVINLEMWLCDVTLFVFGSFPERIFIKAIERE